MAVSSLNPTPTRRKAPRGRTLRVAEFFAGIGLVRLALEGNGWQVVFANDIDPDKLEMYKANFGDSQSKFVGLNLMACPRQLA
jgi:site-specific DNA-cytosine methylase